MVCVQGKQPTRTTATVRGRYRVCITVESAGRVGNGPQSVHSTRPCGTIVQRLSLADRGITSWGVGVGVGRCGPPRRK